jgi:hypothetical protein
MKRNNFRRKLYDFLNEKWFNLILYSVLAVVAVILIVFFGTSGDDFIKTFIKDVFSVFFAALVATIFLLLKRWLQSSLEDSLKTTNDHHAIIRKYHGYQGIAADETPFRTTKFDKEGKFLRIFCVPTKRRKAKPTIKDKCSKEAARENAAIYSYKNGEKPFVTLPSVAVFINSGFDASLSFNDDPVSQEKMDDNIIANAPFLIGAHNFSKISNNKTIRLDGADYDEKSNVLNLSTSRTSYYHMLISNRCMDYEFNNGITLRNMFEYGSTVSPLEKSKLSNQIGINGLIFSSDGWVLIEKRGRNKSTWKNEFGQPLSLSMKESKLEINKTSSKIEPGEESAENAIRNIISDSIERGYGLEMDKDYSFDLKHNFLGVVRDLLEGGKPNLYFSIVVNLEAKKLRQRLNEYGGRNVIAKANTEFSSFEKEKGEKPDTSMSYEKYSSSFFLAKWSSLSIDYYYRMAFSHLSGNDKPMKIQFGKRDKDKTKEETKKKEKPSCGKKLKLLKSRCRILHLRKPRACGEGLLTCIALAEAVGGADRIKEFEGLGEKENADG